jgi:hypothetical protein
MLSLVRIAAGAAAGCLIAALSAVTAHAGTGTVDITDENANGAILGTQVDSWVGGTRCENNTAATGTTKLQVSNLSTATVDVYSGPNCTGPLLAVAPRVSIITVEIIKPGFSIKPEA